MSLKALECLPSPPTMTSKLITAGEDILYHIIRFLHVRDVVLLQRTNRYMHRLTSSRAVWLNALRDQCIENDVPLCTYSFNDMDAYQLKHATIRPYLFLRMIEQPEGKLCATEQITFDLHVPNLDAPTMLNDDDDDDGWQDYTINDLKVIPGGRFLITCCEQGYIQCWDLDKRAPDGRLHQIASIHTGAIAEIMIIQRSVESPSKFIILVHPRHPEDENGTCPYSVHSLDLEYDDGSGEKAPRFECLARFLAPATCVAFELEGDIAMVTYHRELVLFNWKTGLWDQVYIDTPRPSMTIQRSLGCLKQSHLWAVQKYRHGPEGTGSNAPASWWYHVIPLPSVSFASLEDAREAHRSSRTPPLNSSSCSNVFPMSGATGYTLWSSNIGWRPHKLPQYEHQKRLDVMLMVDGIAEPSQLYLMENGPFEEKTSTPGGEPICRKYPETCEPILTESIPASFLRYNALRKIYHTMDERLLSLGVTDTGIHASLYTPSFIGRQSSFAQSSKNGEARKIAHTQFNPITLWLDPWRGNMFLQNDNAEAVTSGHINVIKFKLIDEDDDRDSLDGSSDSYGSALEEINTPTVDELQPLPEDPGYGHDMSDVFD